MELQVNQVERYRFEFKNIKKWKKYLEQNGYVVVANYISYEQCSEYVNEFWDIIEDLAEGKVDRNKPETQILGKNYPPVLHGGMIQYIAHSKPQWQLRLLTKPIFEQLWKENDLKSSFDGLCFMNGRRNYKARQDNAFLHTDQSPTKNYLWSYQGVMTLTDSGKNQGGFVCIPKSHNYHQQFFKKNKIEKHKDNWYLFSDKDKQNDKFLNQCIKLNTKAGDFILFDSRTFHCNTVPTEKVLRVCTYICMIPRNLVPQNIQQKRRKGIEQKRTSNHHPGDGFKLFPVIPRYLENPKQFQKKLKRINSFELIQKYKQLI